MKSVKMIAKIGDQQISVGTCNPAQARILVRDGLAAWQDGSLILHIRPVHLNLLASNPNLWRCKDDNDNTSQGELDRRKAWFLQFLPLAAEALTKGKSVMGDLEHIQTATRYLMSLSNRMWQFWDKAEAVDDPLDPYYLEGEEPSLNLATWPEKPKSRFSNEDPSPWTEVEALASMWPCDVDVACIFGRVPERIYPTYIMVQPEEEDQDAKVIETVFTPLSYREDPKSPEDTLTITLH